MAKKGPRENVGLVCTKCGAFNYISEFNKVNERLKKQTQGEGTFPIKKYCRRCDAHTPHKLQKKLK
jgi:ribosomal protein L33